MCDAKSLTLTLSPQAGRGNAPTAWLLTDGKIGDEIPARGLAEAMGLAPESRIVRPHKIIAALAPWGFADPFDARSALKPPFPDIAFAAGRRAVPYLRAVKKLSPDTFTVFLGDPRTCRSGADCLWAPAHDDVAGPHVIVTDIAPHTRTAEALGAAKQNPDPRVAALPVPRVALLIGGLARRQAFDGQALIEAARAIRAQNFSLVATVSRRTPPAFAAELRQAFAADPKTFIWAGDGENLYVAMLALADAILVTADSTNMVGEALAAGVPVHVIGAPPAGSRHATFLDRLVARGAVRRWQGRVETWPAKPWDETKTIAAEVARRFTAFQQAHAR